MLPNPFDLENAIQDLKDAHPTAEQRDRLLTAALGPRRRRGLKLPGIAAAATLALLPLLLLIPTRGSGLAWSEVLRKAQHVSNLHITSVDKTGRVVGESWQSGPNFAAWRKDPTGRVIYENRSDSRTLYFYFFRKGLTNPNAVQYATVFGKTAAMLAGEKQWEIPPDTIKTLLTSGRANLISQEDFESDGRAMERYHVLLYSDPTVIEADQSSGRILAVHEKSGEMERIDYPSSIAPRVFSFDSRLVRNVYLVDRRGHPDLRKEPPFMPKVIASKGGIRFRGATLNMDGDLMCYWTGYLPGHMRSRGIRVFGVKTGKTLWLGYFKDQVHPVSGPHSKRLVCYQVALPEKIGDRITLRIPTRTAVVEFKDVPVRHLRPTSR